MEQFKIDRHIIGQFPAVSVEERMLAEQMRNEYFSIFAVRLRNKSISIEEL